MTSRLALSAFAATALTAGVAYAGPFTTSPVVLDTTTLTTELNAPLALPSFNTALGTLTSVHIDETGTLNLVGGTITNTSSSMQTYTFSETSTFTFSSSNPTLTPLPTVTPVTSLQTVTLNPGAMAPITAESSMATSGDQNFTSPAILALFDSGTAPTVTVTTLTGETFLGGGGNAALNVTTTADGQISIYFDYTTQSPPINTPEPASIAVLGAGLAGLGLIRRRRG